MTPPDARELISRAIRSRTRLAFHYRGSPRVVEPSAVGADAAGTAKLRGYQVEGRSSSGTVDGVTPKLFELDRISQLTDTGERFEPSPLYRKNDSALAVIWEQL